MIKVPRNFLSIAIFASMSPAMQVQAQAVTQVANQAATQTAMVISTAGFGDIKIGMTLEDAQKALGEPLRKVSAQSDAACFYTPASQERLVVRVKAGKVVSVDTSSAQAGVTRSGLRVGDPADKAKSIYGKEPSYKESTSPFDKRPVVTVGGGANQVAVATHDGKVDLIRVGIASDLWGRCE